MTREEAFRAGFENPLIGANAPLQRLYGTISALGEELGGADMGTPVGTKFREKQAATKSEVKRLQKLREQFPEEFGRGQMQAQEQADPYMFGLGLSPFGLRPGVVGGERMLPGAGGRPMLPRGGIMEGEVMSPLPQIEGPLYDLSKRNAPISPQTSQFERNAVAAMQVRPRGFGYGYQAPSYFEEGGQGFRPSIEDFVPVEVRRNPQQFYDQTAMDQMAAEMQAGNHQAFRNPIYGPNANRPNYGEGAEGKGYFGNMPNPGVRSGVRQEIGQGAGMPRLRYEPVGSSEIQGEFREVPPQGQIPYGMGYRPNFTMQGETYTPSAAGQYGMGEPAGYRGGVGAGLGAGAAMMAVPVGMYAGLSSERPVSSLAPSGNIPPSTPLTGSNVPPAAVLNSDVMPSMYYDFGRNIAGGPQGGGGRMDMMNAFPVQPMQPRAKPSRKAAAGQTREPAVMPLPPRRPEEMNAQNWEGNLNYQITQLIDQLVGQGEAERGRQTQEYYATNPYPY